MWTRAQLKQNAKDVLRNNYWMAFLVSLVAGILYGSGGGASGSGGVHVNVSNGTIHHTTIEPETATVLMLAVFVVAALAFLLGLAYSFFVSGPIQVGKNRYYLESREVKSSFGKLFYAFSHNYLSGAAAMFVTNLFIGLWSLLFIVPGIIKGLAWSQVPYLLAENPGMSGARARELSARMTDGHKWNIFVLQLSFLGWLLLGSLACGVGALFVSPYVEATFAELYTTLRGNALENGWAAPEELPGVACNA